MSTTPEEVTNQPLDREVPGIHIGIFNVGGAVSRPHAVWQRQDSARGNLRHYRGRYESKRINAEPLTGDSGGWPPRPACVRWPL